MAEPLAAFPDVKDESDRELAARHQVAVRELDGVTVDGLVYEYRTQFHRDPLVTQDGTAYFLSVRGHVWDEFGERMELGEEELERLKQVHDEQFRASVGQGASDEAMILTKE
ncbi:hypothetical protein [Halorussus salinisoli]|uniref:hypothetical protein n=1 Tax=Halorussus salinisoli TaxID=2558242 RepID=UPI0010C1B497|nr:hypothetical protein [Halorussus salinisoli]